MPNRLVKAVACHRRRSSATALAGFAAVALLGVAAMASATSFTLKVAKNVHVTNTPTKAFAVKPVDTHENVAVGPSGFAVYTFQGETTHHIICQKTTNSKTNCWAFWPPVSPSGSAAVTKQSGISGKLGTFKNHGTTQLTLNGQPLYYFTPDIMAKNKHQALGDELKTFGSTWHIVKAAGGQSAAGSGSSTMQTTSTGTSTNPYPPGY
jgi:predicted lipoprotein with Yx(FWY)xxD motif